jgi:hypothetical protein
MSAGEQRIFKGIKEEKNFRYLKFDKGLHDDIVHAMCSNQSTHQLKPIYYASNPKSQDNKIVTLITST